MILYIVGAFVLGLVIGVSATYKLLDPDDVWQDGFDEGKEFFEKYCKED